MIFNSLGLGVFDGLHLGHQHILNQSDTLLTFSPHPDEVLKKKAIVPKLSSLDELRYWVPHLQVIPFTNALSKFTAKEFLNFIYQKYGFKKLVVGYDFGFGHQQKGGQNELQNWGNSNHVDIEIIPAINDSKDLPIKSSNIRHLIKNSEFDTAIQNLGHPYPLFGTVVKGDSKGRELGFPTANIMVENTKLIPNSGVYLGYVIYQNQSIKAMIYIGHKPTIKTDPLQRPNIEVHLLDFNENLYGQPLKVFVSRFIRGEQKFDSESALINQIKIDISKA